MSIHKEQNKRPYVEQIVADRLGIKAGDVVDTINGRKLRSAVEALQVLKKAWGSKQFEMELTRRDERMVLTIPTVLFKRESVP